MKIEFAHISTIIFVISASNYVSIQTFKEIRGFTFSEHYPQFFCSTEKIFQISTIEGNILIASMIMHLSSHMQKFVVYGLLKHLQKPFFPQMKIFPFFLLNL